MAIRLKITNNAIKVFICCILLITLFGIFDSLTRSTSDCKLFNQQGFEIPPLFPPTQSNATSVGINNVSNKAESEPESQDDSLLRISTRTKEDQRGSSGEESVTRPKNVKTNLPLLTSNLKLKIVERPTNVKPKRPILKFGVGNGLHNQLMSLIDGIVLAILFMEHYDVVLPIFYGSANPSENKTETISFGELYDAKHFIECVSMFTNNSLRVYEEIPSNYTTQNIKYTPKHEGRKVNDENNWNSTQTALMKYAKPDKAINIGRWYAKFQYLLPETKHFSIRRNVVRCIKPALAIEKVVTKAVRKMREMHSSNVASIHMRLEDDWKQHCKIKDCWIPQEEWISRLQEENAPSPIFAFGGAKINRTIFEENNFAVFTKHDLLEPRDLSSFQYASHHACIDFFIALETDRNYGFMLSSMDNLLYEFRLYQCKPLDSIHFRQFGSDWVQKVGGWTKSFFFYRLDDLTCHYKISSDQCKNIPPVNSKACDDLIGEAVYRKLLKQS